MNDMKLIKQGAEAKLYQGIYLGKPCIVKERFKKNYRHPDLDNQLTKERMRAESRAIAKCRLVGINTPTLYLVDLKRRMIFMEYFSNSITAKEYIYNASEEQIECLSLEIGKVLASMHSNNIIHGDLTTSNMLLVNVNGEADYSDFNKLKFVFIDFGLAHTDCSVEDKGVDLYVLERALISTHSISSQIFPLILKSYKNEYKNCKDIIAKFNDVRARGRKRTMIG